MAQILDFSEPNRNDYLILGGGYFGLKAAQKLLQSGAEKSRSSLNKGAAVDPGRSSDRNLETTGKGNRIWILDKRIDCLSFSQLKSVKKGSIYFVIADVVDFLDAFLSLAWVIENAGKVMIVPAVPFHLAAEWLIKSLGTISQFKIGRITLESAWNLPFEYLDPLGNRYLSVATWRCSENCLPKPGYCSFTKTARPVDLFTLIEKKAQKNKALQKATIRVIKSEQLAPGLGAYPCSELISLKEEAVKQVSGHKILVATACTCHGVATAFQVDSI